METRVDVPFSKKKVARELGIRFDKQTREWMTDEETAEKFKSIIAKEEQESTDTSGHTYMQELYYGSQPPEIATDKDEIEDGSEFSICVSNLDTTLDMASWVFKNGMPKSPSDRTTVLRVLGTRNPMQYPIKYDSMLCCPSFAELYPATRLCELIQRCITGARSWRDEVIQSDLTDEEKALLFLALPLER